MFTHLRPAPPATLADADAIMFGDPDAGTISRVVMECITLARRHRSPESAQFWLNAAYRGISKWDRPACYTLRSLQRQVSAAQIHLSTRTAA